MVENNTIDIAISSQCQCLVHAITDLVPGAVLCLGWRACGEAEEPRGLMEPNFSGQWLHCALGPAKFSRANRLKWLQSLAPFSWPSAIAFCTNRRLTKCSVWRIVLFPLAVFVCCSSALPAIA